MCKICCQVWRVEIIESRPTGQPMRLARLEGSPRCGAAVPLLAIDVGRPPPVGPGQSILRDKDLPPLRLPSPFKGPDLFRQPPCSRQATGATGSTSHLSIFSPSI